ncbi:DUF868 domain-containing protein [Cephalotus follicularis]|uniref:DUF868 domain-containing protein n=1 Tax=Cephalotus follicularis TaxID=3775 RepID=A0A1Q3AW51_CEPFO|nr:DUF868 domain-containing protein [Cephalotus follicularis]
MSQTHHSSSPFPSCFRPITTAKENHHSPPPISGNPNLTTCLYHTHLGLFSLTWSRSFLGHSLHLHHHHHHDFTSSPLSLTNHPLSLSTLIFHLHIKPFMFWKKSGSKRLSNTTPPNIHIFWDLSKAKFGSGPEPLSGVYISVVVDGEMSLLVGDLTKEAYAKTKALRPGSPQVLVLRREHMFGNKVYTSKARFGGKEREISIDCSSTSDARLCFSVDNKKVLQIKRLKWKFRGNERIEVDGVPIQVSWDVYNWLFEDCNNGHAVFMFRFENLGGFEEQEREEEWGSEVNSGHVNEKNDKVVSWQQNSCSIGMNGIEWRKMRKSLMRTARSSSSSSISMSSASSGCSSSVMEWASSEESELSGPVGFSLLIYAWKKK